MVSEIFSYSESLEEDSEGEGLITNQSPFQVTLIGEISEGFERHSNKEYIRFLYIPRGSSGECRTLLYLAKRLKDMNENKAYKFIEESRQISSMIYGLIKTRENNFK